MFSFLCPKILWFCYGWKESLSERETEGKRDVWNEINEMVSSMIPPPTISMRLAFSFEHIFKALSLSLFLFLVIFKWFDELLFVEPTQRKFDPYKYVMIIERCFFFIFIYIIKTGTVNAWQRTLRPFTDLYLLIESTNLIAKTYSAFMLFPIWIYIRFSANN